MLATVGQADMGNRVNALKAGLPALVLPGLVLAASAFSLGRFACERLDVPTDADYEAAAAHIRAGHTAGDMVFVAPAWSLRPWQTLGHLAPTSGDVAGTAALLRAPHVFMLEEPDGQAAFDATVARLGAPRSTEAFGAVRVHTFDRPAAAGNVQDLRPRFLAGRVRIEDSAGNVAAACDRRRGDTLSCKGRPGWQQVRLERQLVTENGQQVLWAHPPVKGETLVLSADDLPPARHLVVRTGHTRMAAQRAKGTVVLDAFVDGTPVGTVTTPPRYDFAETVLDLPAAAGAPGTHTVTLRVHTNDNGGNHFMLDALWVPGDMP